MQVEVVVILFSHVASQFLELLISQARFSSKKGPFPGIVAAAVSGIHAIDNLLINPHICINRDDSCFLKGIIFQKNHRWLLSSQVSLFRRTDHGDITLTLQDFCTVAVLRGS